MVRIETLNGLSQLQKSGFGQPAPRHGLNLLYWFARDCFTIDVYGDMVPKVKPASGDFGFHRFENRIEDDNDHLLPVRNLTYYEVGNLNSRNASRLPQYVREDYNESNPESNKDRIIVYLDASGNFERVYVTEHNSRSGFNHNRTYRISQGLLKNIKNMEKERFLQEMNKTKPVYFHEQNYRENQSWCTIL